jgi:predicted SprT family Zn-dependent metalloprotease
MHITKAKHLAQKTMTAHGLTGWAFEFDDSVRRFGACHWTTKKITLSRALVRLNDEARVLNTILHEIAHALTPGVWHGPAWVEMAKAIGCDGRRCYESDKVVGVARPFTGTCPKCPGVVFNRFRRIRDAYHKPCRTRLVWRRNK